MRAVLKTYANNDPHQFKAIKVRFTKPVIPGQTLKVDMWKASNTRVLFKTTCVETGQEVHTGEWLIRKCNYFFGPSVHSMRLFLSPRTLSLSSFSVAVCVTFDVHSLEFPIRAKVQLEFVFQFQLLCSPKRRHFFASQR